MSDDGGTLGTTGADEPDEPDESPLSPADEAHVHDLLAALPDPEVPDDVRERIAAALASSPPGAGATVLPTRPRAVASSPTGRWRHPRLLQGAAVLVIVALVGAAGWGLVASRSDNGVPGTVAGDGGGPGSSAAGVITTSGTTYTAANLSPMVREMLGGPTPSGDGLSAATVEGSASAATRALIALVQVPTSRQACLDRLGGTPGEQALAIDVGTFNAKPAAVIVMPSSLDQGKVDVWVVGATCTDADNPFPYQYQQVTRP